MDEDVVLMKTDKGLVEIKTRQNKLNSRVRAILIVADGQATIGELLVKFQHIDSIEDDIQNLVKYGFLRIVHDFKKQRMALSRALTDVMGPHADYFTLQIEDCRNIRELTDFIDDKHEMLERGLGQRGEAFWDKVREITG